MGKNNFELLKLAEKHLGQGGAIFRKYCGMSNGAWCCAFVTYEFHEGDDSYLFYGGKKVVYCPTAIQWCRANLAQIPIYLALPMDIIFFDWNANNVPDHIGFVRERKTDQEVYTIEGNTSGGIVANKVRPNKYVLGCYRPAFPAKFDTSKPLVIDGFFGYNSIACLQLALKKKGYYKMDVDGILGKGTVKALQACVGVAQDGSWGVKTSKAVQRMVGASVDGAFGPASTKKLQQWINKQNKVTASTPSTHVNSEVNIPTQAQKICDRAKDYCYPLGTAEKKWKYKTGAPTSAYKKACSKKDRETMSDCGYFVKIVLKNSVGVAFNPLDDKMPSSFKLVHNGGKIKDGELKAGDIVAYKKKKGRHTLIYMGGGVIAEAGREVRFPVLRKSAKYNGDDVKKSTIRVYRAK